MCEVHAGLERRLSRKRLEKSIFPPCFEAPVRNISQRDDIACTKCTGVPIGVRAVHPQVKRCIGNEWMLDDCLCGESPTRSSLSFEQLRRKPFFRKLNQLKGRHRIYTDDETQPYRDLRQHFGLSVINYWKTYVRTARSSFLFEGLTPIHRRRECKPLHTPTTRRTQTSQWSVP